MVSGHCTLDLIDGHVFSFALKITVTPLPLDHEAVRTDTLNVEKLWL